MNSDKKNVVQLSNASFQNYIREMVKVRGTQNGQGDHKASISRQALTIADAVIMGQFQDISREAKRQMAAANRRTLTAWDIQSAVLQRLNGEVARNAVAEAAKAVTSYGLSAKRG